MSIQIYNFLTQTITIRMFLLSKSFFLFTIAVVLGITDTTEPAEAPENTASMPKRRRIGKAACRKCLQKDVSSVNQSQRRQMSHNLLL